MILRVAKDNLLRLELLVKERDNNDKMTLLIVLMSL